MKEFVEKLIGRLEEAKQNHKPRVDGKTTMRDITVYKTAMGYTISIVNQLAEEYNNGWIPCEKELPKEGTYVLTCDKAGHIFLEIWGGCYTVNHYPTTKFGFDNETIIAWMPLPAPFKKGE